MLPGFSYLKAGSVKEAVRHLEEGEVRVHAGGTDLLGCLRDGIFSTEKIVSLTALDTLRGMEESADGSLRIGALATVAETAASPAVRSRFRGLAEAASVVASPQLREQATVGGNLCQKPRCWYYRGEFECLRKGGDTCFAVDGRSDFHCILGGEDCFIVHPSDLAPALTALEARVTLEGPRGVRAVPVEEFHVSPSQNPRRETVLERGEIATAIEIPSPPRGCRSSYRKVRARQSWDFALAGVALALCLEGERVSRARVVLSGAAPVPWRAKAAEQELTGSTLGGAAARMAARASVSGAAPLAHNAYKIRLFEGLVESELLRLAGA